MLTYEIPDELYGVLEKVAAETGRSVEAVAFEWLASNAPTPRPGEQELEAARERFRRHIGAVSLGRPTGVDNASIDSDLAREYESAQKDG